MTPDYLGNAISGRSITAHYEYERPLCANSGRPISAKAVIEKGRGWSALDELILWALATSLEGESAERALVLRAGKRKRQRAVCPMFSSRQGSLCGDQRSVTVSV